ncbi:hypothetical protein BGZ76_007980, partial [Entomortierella beljakovae]
MDHSSSTSTSFIDIPATTTSEPLHITPNLTDQSESTLPINNSQELSIAVEGGEVVSQDYSKAMEWYLKADEQKQARAQYNIGVMYRDGQ